MPLFKYENQEFIQWNGEPIEGVSYPFNIENMWSYESLASIGLYRPQEPLPVPNGHRIISTKPGWAHDGYVRYIHELEKIELTIEEIRQNMPELSPRQIRMGLRQISITDQVIEDYLQDDPDGLIEWKYANSYRRLHPLVVDLGELLEIPDTQIDDLWMWASEL